MNPNAFVHESATIESDVTIGNDTKVWHDAHIRCGARIGRGCVIGKGVFIDAGVRVGDHCKIQNYACLYAPAVLEEGVFVGPRAILINDKNPRAITPQGEPNEQWEPQGVYLARGVSVGAGAIVMPGITMEEWSMAGAGAVVNSNAMPHDLMLGVPARCLGKVNEAGKVIEIADF